ncbi:MAG TPA: DUF2770 domain-containing protein [Franconibacter pulveris]|nr:DUF2770 domain-containing protein [Franconibacter pulveris]
MQRLIRFLVNNVREHLLVYLALSALLALLDLLWIYAG